MYTFIYWHPDCEQCGVKTSSKTYNHVIDVITCPNCGHIIIPDYYLDDDSPPPSPSPSLNKNEE